ncbi:MAG: hypothetical protein JSC189_000812 [Candidatus Tokpelaia sp. JSC189]|nr:MAG: hypothetical protein JSC189_000812 [Candidatus Tokpelaia sp. JSC189]
MSLKILTASRLTDGHPVWYCTDGGWSKEFSNAAVADTSLACLLFERVAKQAIEKNEIVDATLVDVETRDGRLVALRLRERIRANGPTITSYAQNQSI